METSGSLAARPTRPDRLTIPPTRRWWQRPGGRLESLDGVRAVAVVLVLCRHAVRPFVDGSWRLGPVDLSTPLVNGWMGVDLFFVLSGFLISHHLLARPDGFGGRTGYLAYLRRRAWRILPAYYATILVILAGLVPFYVPGTTRPLHSAVTHVLLLQDVGVNDLLPAFWSLGVEEKFYLLAPLVIWAVCRLAPQRRPVALGLLALGPIVLRTSVLVVSGPAHGYEAWFARFRSPAQLTFDGLVLGMALATAYTDPTWRRRLTAWRRPIGVAGWAAFGLLLIGRPWLDHIDVGDHLWLQSAAAWSAAAVVCSVLVGGPGSAVLSRNGWYPIAVTSYAAYLTHQLVIPMAERVGLVGSGPGWARFVGFVPGFVVLTVAATLLLHLGVERPALRRRDHRRDRARADT